MNADIARAARRIIAEWRGPWTPAPEAFVRMSAAADELDRLLTEAGYPADAVEPARKADRAQLELVG